MARAVFRALGRREPVVWAGQVCLLAVSYYAAGRLGLALSIYHENVTLVWPPTGLSLAALLLFGRRLWPGVLLGALVLTALEGNLDVVPQIGIAIGNTLEALVGATLLVDVARFRFTLDRPRDVGAFLLFGVVACTLVSASIGVALLVWSGSAGELGAWPLLLIWWLGDMMGALIFTPLLLMAFQGTPPWRELLSRGEFWVVGTLLLAACTLSFVGPVPGVPSIALLTPGFPVFVWAGIRLGSRGATLASFVLVSSVVAATVAGLDPLDVDDPSMETVVLWTYSVVVGLTGLMLAALVEQRDAADRRRLAEAAERLQTEKEKLLLVERARFAREMHDGMGGQLVSLLSMVERGTASREDITEGIRQSLDEIRIVVDSLESETIDLPTSLGRLRARLTPLAERNDIAFTWRSDGLDDAVALSPGASLHVLRIIQEAVVNAVRHAGATRIDVMVTSTHGDRRTLELAIRDDGRGLSPITAPGGHGLKNIRDRAGQLGAAIEIVDASPGTHVEVTVPIARASLPHAGPGA